MLDSTLPWLVAIVGVAWAVGAYNRLIRLRAEVNTSFAAVDAELQPLARLVDDMLARAEAGDDEDPPTPSPDFLAPLRETSAQLSACLATARQKPLDGARIQALREAGEAWAAAWERAERQDAHDLAGPQLPETTSTERAIRLRQAEATGALFNEAVDRYNRAIAQIPAVLIASLFGFRSGHRL
jgi:LemA protein